MSTDETRPLPVDATQPLPPDDGTEHRTEHRTEQGTADATTDAGAADATTDDADAAAPTRDRVRVGTIVWGLVIALLGAGVLVIAAGYTIDLELAAIGLLVLAGLALIVGPLVANARRRTDDPAGSRG
ncbi:hypothetical protein AB6N23_15430 [Cellulomonas sp. 179-A 9B4 NHS]|uniref:hypothetical protein n=1 Tax=Cellulomonas sp. 179-A 9B4 NHS TaxID=3142379 RepID=UPI00399FC9C6